MTIYTPEEVVLYDAECLMNELREQRNLLLAETDWYVLSDAPETATAELLTYRQTLRDLPATASPEWKHNEETGVRECTGVDWPVKPPSK